MREILSKYIQGALARRHNVFRRHRVKFLIPALALLLPSLVFADSQCVSLHGSSLINRCETCVEVTVHELRPPAEQGAGLFSGASRITRLEAGKRDTLQGDGDWMIGDIKKCQ